MAEAGYSATLIAPAKLNLSLTILGKRPDGYHDLVSLVAFADLHDRLVVTPSETGTDRLSAVGPFARSLDRDNLILRAISAFRNAVGPVPPLSITLHKAIPVAAGLGGGSADAAAILRMLAGEHGLAVMAPPVQAIAAALGADIPVCLDSRCRYMRGTGVTLDPEEPAFPRYPALLVNPGVAVPTGAVFGALAPGQKAVRDASAPPGLSEEILAGRNDLEAPAVSVAPEIGPVLTALSDLPGAIGARLSGSGATCFVLFESDAERDKAAEHFRHAHPACWSHAGELKNWNDSSLRGFSPQA